MSDGTFEKVSRSEKPLYGRPKLLLCGFAADTQPKFETVLGRIDLAGVPLVWVTEEQAAERLSTLTSLPDGTGLGTSSNLPRAIIVSGIMESDLHRLMGFCKKTGMQQALWAVLTPISETWALQDLLAELAAERDAMANRKQNKS